MRTTIIGTGSFLPKKVVTNDELAQYLDTSDEWIVSRTGIKQRQLADYKGEESCSFMGLKAAEKALEMAQISSQDIDLIIVATLTADYRLPTVSCMLQGALKAQHAPAFDISAACSGSLYAASIADSFIKNGTYKNVLVVASEVMSSVVDWSDRNTAVLFGDGASAAVLSASNKPDVGFIDFDLYADGALKDVIHVPAGGSFCPIDEQVLKDKSDKVRMNGRETFKFAVRAVSDSVEKILADNNISMSDVSFVVPHQANARIIEAIAKRVDVPMDRFLVNLDRCANTSAASLFMAYDEAKRAHVFKTGDIILMLAIGAGFVWGAGLYRVG